MSAPCAAQSIDAEDGDSDHLASSTGRSTLQSPRHRYAAAGRVAALERAAGTVGRGDGQAGAAGATEPPAVGAAQLIELVRSIRAGDRALRSSATRTVSATIDVPGMTTAATLGLLQAAAAANQAVLLGYVNAQGSASSARPTWPVIMESRSTRPDAASSMAAGQVCAYRKAPVMTNTRSWTAR